MKMPPAPRRHLWAAYVTTLWGTGSSVVWHQDYRNGALFFVAGGFVYLYLHLTREAA